MRLVRRFRSDERGNMAIMAAIVIPAAVAAAGAAMSYSSSSSVRTDAQAALDSAVLAGAILPYTATDDERIAAAKATFAKNLSSYDRGTTTQIDASFTVANPGGVVQVSGQAGGAVKNPFGGLVGSDTVQVGAGAVATKQLSAPICVLGLNGMDNGAMDMNGTPQFTAKDCATQANSNSRSGLTQEGKPVARAAQFGVSGGHKGDHFSPPPVDGVKPVPDPFASIPFPALSKCVPGSGTIKKDDTLHPGTYCGGLHIDGSGIKVTLTPGVYIMKDGPLWVDSQATVTGNDVMIAFTGKDSTLRLWGGAAMQVTSPKTGTYANMQFMQDRMDLDSRGLWVSIGGTANLQYDGTAYFPMQNIWIFGNSVVNGNSPTVAMVGDKVWLQGSAEVNITHDNPRNVKVSGSPQFQYGARLTN